MKILAEFLPMMKGERFSWARYGCAALPAAWAAFRNGGDAFAGLPPCETQGEVERIIAEAGGMVPLFDRQLRGMADKHVLHVGAIGVAHLPEGVMAGIVSETRWVFLIETGLRAMPVAPHRVAATWVVHG